MIRYFFIIFFFADWVHSFGQNPFEGQWITSSKRGWFNNHLCVVKETSVSLEEYGWSSYEVNQDTLIINEEEGYKTHFIIKSLTRDSIELLPVKVEEFVIENGIRNRIFRLGKITVPLKLFNRDFLYSSIDFDSISYSSKEPPHYLYSYYSPGVEIISKINRNGEANYYRHETDTLKTSDLTKKRRIKFSDNEIHEANVTGHIPDTLLAEFKSLLNNSNIKNIEVNRDFRSYLNQFHSSPSTLEVYKNGKVQYRIHTTEYPLTLRPVISFLEDLVNKVR